MAATLSKMGESGDMDYEVIGMQSLQNDGVLRALSHDHDYCEQVCVCVCV